MPCLMCCHVIEDDGIIIIIIVIIDECSHISYWLNTTVQNINCNDFVSLLGLIFCEIQPIVSTCIAMTSKSDVRKYTKNLVKETPTNITEKNNV